MAILTIDQNRAVVRAAIEEANASRETVEEMRRQRELAYQHWLVVERVAPEHPTDRIAVPAYRVTNIGAGPAINVALSAMRVRAAADPVHLWVSDETQGIEPGGRWDVFAGFTTSQGKAGGTRADRYRCVTDDLARLIVEVAIVAVRYQDLLGVHYRTSPDERRAQSPEALARGATAIDAPDWLRCES